MNNDKINELIDKLETAADENLVGSTKTINIDEIKFLARLVGALEHIKTLRAYEISQCSSIAIMALNGKWSDK